jgi:hypothetical protein
MEEIPFNDRFISLGLTVSLNEDWETKKEIDFATSKQSLLSIKDICGAEVNKYGTALIDVKKFLHLCNKLVQSLTDEMYEETSIAAVQENVNVNVNIPEIVVDEIEDVMSEEESIQEASPPSPLVFMPKLEKEEGIEEELLSQKRSPKHAATTTTTTATTRNTTSSSGGMEIRISECGSTAESALETIIMDTLRQTDLYHLIQVST